MDDIRLTRTLLDLGYDYGDLRRLRRDGELVRVRRGAYARVDNPDQLVEERHRRLVLGTAPQLRDGAVLSHGSAAVLHGLPVWPAAVQRVHVTRNRRGNGVKRSLVQVHGAPLLALDIVMIENMPVTSLRRTVLDLARTLPMMEAVAAGDRALALGLTRFELDAGLLAMERWPGVRAARRVIEFLDERSESPGESASRVRLMEEGLPRPEPQHEIFGPDDRLIAVLTSTGRSTRRSASSMERSNMAGCSNPGSGSRTCSSMRNSARTPYAISACRSSAGFRATCIASASFEKGCSAHSLGPANATPHQLLGRGITRSCSQDQAIDAEWRRWRRYYMGSASYTSTLPPDWRTGHPLAFVAASSRDSAV
ncbi:MAG TPA: type IV toxin-antitoxin system AbiEi family antitoxin domain-containing protein, partial [Propionibacteriaceae bacterium]|nr:type IV toxin-antitoxin system AbiEi family antitoxin domain-containing protein [Propionibacteriaceae bacterium]